MTISPKERIRLWREKRKAEIESMPKLPCACGCGTLIAPMNYNGVENQYVKGHGTKGKKTGQIPHNRIGDKPLTDYEKYSRYRDKRWAEILEMEKIPCACGCGTMIPPFNRLLKPAKYAMGHTVLINGIENRWGKGHIPWTKDKFGEQHPSWRGGTSTLPYGPEFTRRFKKLIRERDNYTCQRCGITQEEYGKTLMVHHLDHNKLNNDPTNLVTACLQCNNWASNHRDEPFIPAE